MQDPAGRSLLAPAAAVAPSVEADVELDRMRAVRALGILDTPPDPAFDDLTALAARLCAMPMALVSLVDTERFWFKSRWGFDAGWIARDVSLCESALTCSDVLTIPDALADLRFRDNPTVTGAAGIRAYAGAPLVTSDGIAVGVLCVLDTVPRMLSGRQLDDLALLARQVVSLLELRRQAESLRSEIAAKEGAEAELRRSRHVLDELLAHTDVLVYAKDLDGRFVIANAALERTMGQRPGRMLGRTGEEVFPASAAESFRRNDSQILSTQTPGIASWEVFQEQLEVPDGSIHTYRSTKFPLVDDHGEVYAVAGVSTDITELTAVRAEMAESVRRFGALFDISPVGIALSDEQGLWFQANAAFGRLLGVSPSEMIGRSALEFAHPDDHAIIAGSELGQLSSPDGVMRTELRFPQRDGSVRCAWVNVTPLPGPNGEHWTLGIAEDITDRKEAETALRRSEEELAAIAAVARCVQSGTDPRPVVAAAVRSLADAAHVRLLEPSAAGAMVVTAHDGIDPGLTVAAESVADEVRRTGKAVLQPADWTPGDDHRPPISEPEPPGSVLWQPVVAEGEVIAVLNVTWSGAVTGLDARPVQAVRALAGEAGASLHAAQLRSELERAATTDPLTGALNRRAWATQLQQLMDRSLAQSTTLTVVLIDLDNFKAFNDGFGHAAGDELLRVFATDVRPLMRRGDLFARWGGEEFILALVDCDRPLTERTLQRIRRAVPGTQTCSIGHARWQPPEPIDSCIGRADAALYRAKRTGRDRVVSS